jgi:hypothetical protein
MAQTLIRDIPACAELVQRIVAEATTIIRDRLGSALEPAAPVGA